MVITKGYPNACTVATLIAPYSSAVKDSPLTSKHRFNANMAAAGLKCVATFIRDFANWSFHIMDVIIFSMDYSIIGNVGIGWNITQNQVDLLRYTSRAASNIAEYADLLEWSVPDDLRAKFNPRSTSKHVGVVIANYEAAAETSIKLVLLSLRICGMCSGFAIKSDKLKTKFVHKLI